MNTLFKRFLFASIAIAAVVVSPQSLEAHQLDYTAIKTRMVLADDQINFTTELPTVFDLPATEEDRAQMEAYYDERFKIINGGDSCAVAVDRLVSGDEQQSARVEGTVTCPNGISDIDAVSVQSSVFTNLYKHMDHFVTLVAGDERRESVFSAGTSTGGDTSVVKQNDSKTLSSTAADNTAVAGEQGAPGFNVVKRFLSLGVWHILLGIDHILFIVVVHLIVRKWKDIVLLVTSFTIAHSVTLILAAYSVIQLTSKIVEPVIALSIVIMAVRNIIIERRGEMFKLRERWIGTFGFGLIHGLGFAGALAEVEIPRKYFLAALLSFNGGVEIGQLLVIAMILMIVFFVGKTGKLKPLIYSVSAVVGLVALYWFIERLF